MFTDCNNHPLNVGDKVIFIADCTRNPHLEFGIIKRIYKTGKACTVNSHSNVYHDRIAKLPLEAPLNISNEHE